MRRPSPIDTVFLDRDGTINRKARDGAYITSPDDLELLPGAAEGIRLLNEHQFRVIVVTNQRGIALGRMSVEALERIHRRLVEELHVIGARVDAIYYCPHDVGTCGCRKPEVGMPLRAQRDHPTLVLENSVIIGDSESDMEMGARLGLMRILVATGNVSLQREAPVAGRVSPSLLDAARWLVG